MTVKTPAPGASPVQAMLAAGNDGVLLEPIATLAEPGHLGWAREGAYAWTETTAIEGFFVILTAVAVPLWITRVALRVKRWRHSGTNLRAPRDTGATAGGGPQPLLTEKQQDRRGDKDRRRSANDDPENNRQREAAQNLAAD